MKQEIAERWAGKLESGDYPQTTGALNRVVGDGDKPIGFCCLGVLCEIAVEDGIVTKKLRSPYADAMWYGRENSLDFNGSTAFLPPEVYKWAGLKGDSVWFDVTEIVDTLNDDTEVIELKDGRKIASAISLNDSGALNFKQIAELVRNNKIVDYNEDMLKQA